MCLCNIESPVEFLNMTSNEDQRDQQKECGCYGPFGLHSIACIHAVKNRQPSVREIVEGKAELDAALDDISNEAYLKAGAAAFATMSEKDILLAMQVADAKLELFPKMTVMLARAWDRIHCLPRTSDSALAAQISDVLAVAQKLYDGKLP